jgi:hypothetical protein
LLAGTYFILADRNADVNISGQGEYNLDEARIAYKEARNALLLVSQVMNTGASQLEPLSKISEVADELSMINRFHLGVEELQVLSEFEKAKEKITFNN